MTTKEFSIRKTYAQLEELRDVFGERDDEGPLRKVAIAVVVKNPFAGQGYTEDLTDLITASEAVGDYIGSEAVRLLGSAVASYGKAGMAGVLGEQEHVNAALTSVFGNAFRKSIGGGKAWITSTTKLATAGTNIDVPLAYKDEIWVRSHYDTFEVRVPDAPLPDELVIIGAVSNRGRINARVGGMTVAEAQS